MRHFQLAKSAIEQQLKSLQGEGPPPAPLQVALAEVQAALGDREGAAESLAHAGPVAGAPQRSAMRLAVVIRVLVPLGEHDRALAELDASLSGPGGCTIESLLADPRLDPLRTHPHYPALVAKYQSK
jgi:hypothetical protein